MQNNNSNYKRRPNYNNSNRSKPISYFIHGTVLLAVFIIPVSIFYNLIGIIVPEIVSKKVYAFSTPMTLESCCMQKKKKNEICSKILKFRGANKTVEIKKIQEKFYPIVKKGQRFKSTKRIILNLFLMAGLLLFLRRYKR